jgi:hypothetical protein
MEIWKVNLKLMDGVLNIILQVKKIIGKVEELNLQSPEDVNAKKYPLPRIQKSLKGNFQVGNHLRISRIF